ncbi:MAG: BON domain-containing protein, partial [Anaerolineae bacterium]
PGSDAGRAAVEIARNTSGVRRVETFFVRAQPSKTTDFELASQVKAAFVADPNVVADDVDVRVYAGNVVLIGVVSSSSQKERFVDDAFAVSGVVSVHSYIQVRS